MRTKFVEENEAHVSRYALISERILNHSQLLSDHTLSLPDNNEASFYINFITVYELNCNRR